MSSSKCNLNFISICSYNDLPLNNGVVILSVTVKFL